MSERATKTFLQSLTANPDSAASSLAKLLTLGMGLGQHDCGKAASAAARSSEHDDDNDACAVFQDASEYERRSLTRHRRCRPLVLAQQLDPLDDRVGGEAGGELRQKRFRSNGLGLHAWNFEAQRTAAQRVHNAQVHRPNLQEVLALLGKSLTTYTPILPVTRPRRGLLVAPTQAPG